MARAPNTSHPHFLNWFPQMDGQFEYLLLHDCWSDYQIYLNNQYLNYQNPLHQNNSHSAAIAPVATCLYKSVWGLAGANMQAAGVLLGLLPTILIFAGSSKVETGVLALRRPMLSMLISLGSPAVNPLRAVDYNAPANILQLWEGSKRHRVPTRNSTAERMVMTLEYVFVLAAIANIVEVTYELCVWAVCSFAPETTFLPALYPALTLVGHILGAIAVSLRVQLVPRNTEDYEHPPIEHVRPLHCRWISKDVFNRWISTEMHLAGSETQHESLTLERPLVLELKQETYWFLFTNWLLSTLATMHLVLGTLVFSSILFISVNDAAVVAVRYLFSTLAVRIILTYELCTLKEVTEVRRPNRADSRLLRVRHKEVMEGEIRPLARGSTV